ncbi:MAG: carbohydrate ABC transporter permease [Lachnospiraceae bacterium]|nr:carbohydrate ABC transporter permease [Lachnospiraceae bacterium]
MKQKFDAYRAKAFTIRWSIRILLLIYTLIVLYPLFWNIMSSFKSTEEILHSLTAFPQGFALDNYVRAFVQANMGEYLFNSIFVVTSSLVMLLIFTIPCAYAMARYQFFGSKVVELLFAMCLFIQTVYIYIPLYSLLHRLNMLDNLFALAFVYAAISIPFSAFLLAGYMRGISPSFEEAAKIDGCGNWKTLFKVVVPMSKPGIITVALLNGMGFWNEYILALVTLRSPENRTLPIGVANLFEVQRRATDFGALYAALMIVLVPTLIMYFIGQSYLTKGIAMGGEKG